MATFTVNGNRVTVSENQKLLRYLRDVLHLTSVKDGCSEGACGSCTVLIDGKPARACIQQTDRLEGKSVLTVEGLSAFERRFTPMLSARPALCSAASASRAWFSLQKGFLL